jgi:hypothetical protein
MLLKRLFTGIELPEDVVARIAALLGELKPLARIHAAAAAGWPLYWRNFLLLPHCVLLLGQLVEVYVS